MRHRKPGRPKGSKNRTSGNGRRGNGKGPLEDRYIAWCPQLGSGFTQDELFDVFVRSINLAKEREESLGFIVQREGRNLCSIVVEKDGKMQIHTILEEPDGRRELRVS